MWCSLLRCRGRLRERQMPIEHGDVNDHAHTNRDGDGHSYCHPDHAERDGD
jgi:hypothetical protein